eukprot:symbB.v1.2.017731.t1/scaffold1366.1/size123243/7
MKELERAEKQIGNRQHYKFTRLCSFYKAGTCSRGLNCSFAHSELQIREQPDFYKTRLCEDFRRGKCLAGEFCQFAHGSEEMKRIAQERRSQRTAPSEAAGKVSGSAFKVAMPVDSSKVNGYHYSLSDVAPDPTALPSCLLTEVSQGSSRRSSVDVERLHFQEPLKMDSRLARPDQEVDRTVTNSFWL